MPARCSFGGECCDLRILKSRHQPLPAEVRHRGHEDEHLGHHDEEDGEQQKLAREPKPVTARAGGFRAGTFYVVAQFQHSLGWQSGERIRLFQG
jgi:hypothetical protein